MSYHGLRDGGLRHVARRGSLVRSGVGRMGRHRGLAESKHGEFAAESIRVGDRTREYRLVVPSTVDLAQRRRW